MPNIAQDILEINPLYARTLGLEENEAVVLIKYPKPPVARCVRISPVNQSDYDILVNHNKEILNCILVDIFFLG